ncbi:hypothetical protein GGX14DRAFT_637624 [Mycena pura]|uniref:Uncharacterized protein n=1 Tax=Mycena pura TaxID=153505 RepID=A0AAD6VAB1_9AGAR|nr:hypothetical protein GGX14DRAFT_637624 [Mycena pura]
MLPPLFGRKHHAIFSSTRPLCPPRPSLRHYMMPVAHAACRPPSVARARVQDPTAAPADTRCTQPVVYATSTLTQDTRCTQPVAHATSHLRLLYAVCLPPSARSANGGPAMGSVQRRMAGCIRALLLSPVPVTCTRCGLVLDALHRRRRSAPRTLMGACGLSLDARRRRRLPLPRACSYERARGSARRRHALSPSQALMEAFRRPFALRANTASTVPHFCFALHFRPGYAPEALPDAEPVQRLFVDTLQTHGIEALFYEERTVSTCFHCDSVIVVISSPTRHQTRLRRVLRLVGVVRRDLGQRRVERQVREVIDRLLRPSDDPHLARDRGGPTSRAPTVALVAVGDTDNVGREITEEILIAMNSENNCVGRTRCAEVPIPSSRASPAPTAGVGRDGVSRGLTLTPYAERPPRSRPRPPTSFRPLVLVIVGDHRVGKD